MDSTDEIKPKHDTVMDVTEEQIERVYAKAFLGATENSADADGMDRCAVASVRARMASVGTGVGLGI